MKNKFIKLCTPIFACSATVAPLLCSCNRQHTTIELDKTSVKLEVGSMSHLKVKVSPSSAKVSWSVDKENVIKVQGAVYDVFNFTANQPGECIVTATANGVSASCKVVVTEQTVLSLDKELLEIKLDETGQINAIVSPKTVVVEWSISDKEMATLTPSGNSVTIKPLKKGSCNVTATANGKSKSCLVNVFDPTLMVEPIHFSANESFNVSLHFGKNWDGELLYSTDKETWKEWDGSGSIGGSTNLYLKGTKNTCFSPKPDSGQATIFIFEGSSDTLLVNCDGDIRALLNYSDISQVVLTDYCFCKMFARCTNLVSGPKLPFTTLKPHCYEGLFLGCTSLTSAPELPAESLAEKCYYCMFQECSKLLVKEKTGWVTVDNKIFKCPNDIPEDAVKDMFDKTGGEFKGDPTAGNTYYWYKE